MSERIFEPLPMDDKLFSSALKASSQSGTKSKSSADDEDEYEEVEEEVEEGGGGGQQAAVSGATGGNDVSKLLSSVLTALKKNHDVLQISTFRNFLVVVLGCVLLLCNRLLSFPPLWLAVLLLTGVFIPSAEAFDQFIAYQTAGQGAVVSST